MIRQVIIIRPLLSIWKGFLTGDCVSRRVNDAPVKTSATKNSIRRPRERPKFYHHVDTAHAVPATALYAGGSIPIHGIARMNRSSAHGIGAPNGDAQKASDGLVLIHDDHISVAEQSAHHLVVWPARLMIV